MKHYEADAGTHAANHSQGCRQEEPAPLALGEYKEVDSYDATRCYQVVDENSKTTFDVTFYLYGDVVSGWDVAVADKASTNKK